MTRQNLRSKYLALTDEPGIRAMLKLAFDEEDKRGEPFDTTGFTVFFLHEPGLFVDDEIVAAWSSYAAYAKELARYEPAAA